MIKRFTLKSFLFFLPIVLFYFVLYKLGYKPILSNSAAFDAKIFEINNRNLGQTNIIAIGSSIALFDLSTAVIRDNSHCSYYNMGSYSLSVEDLNRLIRGYVFRFKPKYVLYPSTFVDYDTVYNRTLPNFFFASYFTPVYYLKNYTNPKYLIDRENSLKAARADVHGFTNLSFDSGGGIALHVSKAIVRHRRVKAEDHFLEIFPTKYAEGNYRSLDSLALFLNKNKIKLFFIQAPLASFIEIDRNKTILAHFARCKSIIKKSNGIYLNFATGDKFPDSLFNDGVHLNYKGSKLFTQKILDSLKSQLK